MWRDELENKVKRMNDEVGNKHLVDNIDCKKCKNKTIIYFLKDDEIRARDCSCLKDRKIYSQIKRSGLEKSFETKTFDNYIAKMDWQKDIKSLAIDYVKNVKDEWFLIFGITGSGKTHISTAISKALIEKGYSYTYLQFTNEIYELVNARETFTDSVRKKGNERFKELVSVDVLYIDDFLKIDERTKNNSYSLVFDLINQRYNQNKITIISTEYSPSQIDEYNSAVMGRITEKANKYIVGNVNDNKRNVRRWGNKWRENQK